MSRIEDLLREEFRRADRADVPARDAMLAKVQRVRRRRLAGVTAVSSVAVAGVAVAAVSLVGVLQPHPSSGQAGGGLSQRMYSGELINVLFTDHRHGYVVQRGCSMDAPTGGSKSASPNHPYGHEVCRSQLLVTTNAGQTWQARALPFEPAVKVVGEDLSMDRWPLLWVDNDGKLAYGGVDLRYWTTADAGLTWQKSPKLKELGSAGSIETFTADDKLAFLAKLPPHGLGDKESARHPIVAAADGSYWVACITGPCVQVTHDRGSTWQTFSTVDSATDVAWVATSDGRTVYAAVRTGTGSRLVRSADAGVTWTDVLGLAQPSAAGVALPNGDVILEQASDKGGVYRVKAGTTTLERLTDVPAHSKVLYLSGGVVVAAPAWSRLDDSELGSLVSVSADGGTTWSAAPAP